MSSSTIPKLKIRRLSLVLALLLLAACTTLPSGPIRITMIADGEQRTIETELTTVRELLATQGVTLGDLDRITPPETAGLRDGLTITIVRVAQQTETFTETVPFGRQVVRDATIPEGETRLLQSGQAGVLERVYRITLEDGIETERTLMQEAVTQSPQDEILLVGTRPKLETVTITGTLAYLKNQDAWVLRNSNRGRRRLTTLGDLDGRVFTLSPDATRLLFTRGVTEPDHINELWMVRTVEADPNPIPLNVSDLLWAGWQPTGQRSGGDLIAWTTAEATEQAPGWRGQNDLWTASLNALNVLVSRRKVLDGEAGGGYGWWGTRYVWSPDGETLAYTRPESVGVVDLRTAALVPLLAFPAYRTYSSWAWNPAIAWSPDGNFIATAIHGPAPTGGDPEESPVFDVWAIEATGAYSTELASEAGMWARPQYAPVDGAHSGERLLFGRAVIPYQSDTSPHVLCLIDRDGSDARCFDAPKDTTGIELPSWYWSPDGKTIAYIHLGGIYLLSIEDEAVIPLVDDGGISLLDWR